MGAAFRIPHGRANAFLLCPVFAFLYPTHKARLCSLATSLGIAGEDDQTKATNLLAALDQLKQKVGIPLSIRDSGVDEDRFLFAPMPALSSRPHGRNRRNTRKAGYPGHLMMTTSHQKLPPIPTSQFLSTVKACPLSPSTIRKNNSRRPFSPYAPSDDLAFLIDFSLQPSSKLNFEGFFPPANHSMPIALPFCSRFSPIHF
jgi:hypothetical protein